MRWPRRIYKRRRVWHWLADSGAPDLLWQLFVRDFWQPCATCGWRGRARVKRAGCYGGGEPSRHYCSSKCYYEREEW